jgi:hypothetical protein
VAEYERYGCGYKPREILNEGHPFVQEHEYGIARRVLGVYFSTVEQYMLRNKK